ncbi:hypothetical protein C8J57DRAFT_1220751 [Mycena rebaudengoi]|nr:hypothetical protein C8J57DRAFT_1220751 [Mycena rebaudengoi]
MSTLQTLSVALAGNPTVELLRLITSFSDEINRYIKGADGCEALLQLIVVYLMEVARRTGPGRLNLGPRAGNPPPPQQCRASYEKFQTDIKATVPDFHPSTKDQDLELDVPRYLDEISECIKRSLTRQLPFNIPFSAKIKLTLLDEMIAEEFGRFSGLEERVRGIVIEGLLQSRIKWLLELESPPFTLNTHYFTSYRKKYLEKCRPERPLIALAYNPKFFDGSGNPGIDQYEQELILATEIRGYWQIGIGKTDASQGYATYLAEEPAIVRQREELCQNEQRLGEVLEKLFNFTF